MDRGELVAGGVAVERPFGVKICSFSSISFEISFRLFVNRNVKSTEKIISYRTCYILPVNRIRASISY